MHPHLADVLSLHEPLVRCQSHSHRQAQIESQWLKIEGPHYRQVREPSGEGGGYGHGHAKEQEKGAYSVKAPAALLIDERRAAHVLLGLHKGCVLLTLNKRRVLLALHNRRSYRRQWSSDPG